jgi:hypothetical protein
METAPDPALTQEPAATGAGPVPDGNGVAAATPELTGAPAPDAAPPDTDPEWEQRFAEHLARMDREALWNARPDVRDYSETKAGRLAQERHARERAAIEQEARQRAYQQAAWEIQQQQAAYEAQEFARLAREDPLAFAERYQQRADQAQQAQQQAAWARAVAQREQNGQYQGMGYHDQAYLYSMIGELEDEAERAEVERRFAQGAYLARDQHGNPDFHATRLAYRNDVMNRKAQAEIKKARTAWEKEKAEALAAQRRELLGEEALEEPSPDTGGSGAGASPNGRMTQKRWNSATFEQREEWKRTIPEQIDEMWRTGR